MFYSFIFYLTKGHKLFTAHIVFTFHILSVTFPLYSYLVNNELYLRLLHMFLFINYCLLDLFLASLYYVDSLLPGKKNLTWQ